MTETRYALIGSEADGDDYDTIALWIAGEQTLGTNLTAAGRDVVLIGILRDMEHSYAADVSISGFTTDDDHGILLTSGADIATFAEASEPDAFKWFGDYKDEGDFVLNFGCHATTPRGARITISNGFSDFSVLNQFTVVERLQFQKNASSNNPFMVLGNTGTNFTSFFRGNIVRGINTHNNHGVITLSEVNLENCLVISEGSDTPGVTILGGVINFCSIVKADATSHTTTFGLDRTAVTAAAENTAVFGFDGRAFETSSTNWTASDNATDDSAPPAYADAVVSNVAYSDQFENSNGDWRTKTGHSLQAANNTSGVPVDILERVRDGTTPTIGCWEHVTIGAGPAIPVFYHHYNQMRGA